MIMYAPLHISSSARWSCQNKDFRLIDLHIWGLYVGTWVCTQNTIRADASPEMQSIECLLVSSQEPIQSTSNINVKCSQIQCCTNIEMAMYGQKLLPISPKIAICKYRLIQEQVVSPLKPAVNMGQRRVLWFYYSESEASVYGENTLHPKISFLCSHL